MAKLRSEALAAAAALGAPYDSNDDDECRGRVAHIARG
jgi:hypothetical protein